MKYNLVIWLLIGAITRADAYALEQRNSGFLQLDESETSEKATQESV